MSLLLCLSFACLKAQTVNFYLVTGNTVYVQLDYQDSHGTYTSNVIAIPFYCGMPAYPVSFSSLTWVSGHPSSGGTFIDYIGYDGDPSCSGVNSVTVTPGNTLCITSLSGCETFYNSCNAVTYTQLCFLWATGTNNLAINGG